MVFIGQSLKRAAKIAWKINHLLQDQHRPGRCPLVGQALSDQRTADTIYAHGIILGYLGFLTGSEIVFHSRPKALELAFFVSPLEVVVGHGVVKDRQSRLSIYRSERVPMCDDIGENAFEAVIAIDKQETVANAGQRLPRITDNDPDAVSVLRTLQIIVTTRIIF